MWTKRLRNLLAELKKDQKLTEEQYATVLYDFIDILEKEIFDVEIDYEETPRSESFSAKIKWSE